MKRFDPKKFLEKAKKGYKKITTKPSMEIEKIRIKEAEIPKIPVPVYPYPMQPTQPEKREEIVIETKKGIKIPEHSRKFFGLKEEEIKVEEKISLTYPLIKEGEKVVAYVKIYWDEKNHRYFYEIFEPKLDEKQKELLEKIKYLIEQRVDVDLNLLKKEEAEKYLRKVFEEVVSLYKIKLSSDEKESMFYHLRRDFIGYGKIDVLMKDDNIEDISCDGVNIPIFVFHRNPKIGSVITNIKFETADELDSFVIKLAQMCGKSISILNPFLNGTLTDGSRVQATLATDIARRGSNFTIRKFTQKPLTPAHLLSFNTLDLKILAYLWLTVEYGQSILVCGGTASGKTSLLNILSMFIRPERKIVSIEDTAELKLLHPHWVPHVARTPIGTKEGEIDLFSLLKESLRQRPDYIIVGEVRGPEAFVLFQEMATGHPSLATIHAENVDKLVSRLITPPINLPPSLIQAVDIIIFIAQTRYRENVVRRITEVYEVIGFDREKNFPILNLVFKWDSLNDKFIDVNESFILRKIAEKWGLKEEEIASEIKKRMLVLEWVKEKNISDYENFYKVLNAYYFYQTRLLELIKEQFQK